MTTYKDIILLPLLIHETWADVNKSEPDKSLIKLNEYWCNLNLPSYEKRDEFEQILINFVSLTAPTIEEKYNFNDLVLRYYRFTAYIMSKSKDLKDVILKQMEISCQSFLNICKFLVYLSYSFNRDIPKMEAILSREIKDVTLSLILEKINPNFKKNILESHFFNQLKSLPNKNDAMTILNSIDAELSVVNLLKQAFINSDLELFEKTVVENNINLAKADQAMNFWSDLQRKSLIIKTIPRLITDGNINDSVIHEQAEILKHNLEVEASNCLSAEQRSRNEILYEISQDPEKADIVKLNFNIPDPIVALISCHFFIKDMSTDIQAVYEMNQLINSSPEYKEIYRKAEEGNLDLCNYHGYDEFNKFAEKWLPTQNQDDTTNLPPELVMFSSILPDWVDKLKVLAELLSKQGPDGHQQYIDPSDVTNFYYRIAGRKAGEDKITETNLQKIKWYGHCMSLKYIILEIYNTYKISVNIESKTPYKLDDFICNYYESLKRGNKMCAIKLHTIKDNPINEDREQLKGAFKEGEREYLISLLVKSKIKK